MKKCGGLLQTCTETHNFHWASWSSCLKTGCFFLAVAEQATFQHNMRAFEFASSIPFSPQKFSGHPPNSSSVDLVLMVVSCLTYAPWSTVVVTDRIPLHSGRSLPLYLCPEPYPSITWHLYYPMKSLTHDSDSLMLVVYKYSSFSVPISPKRIVTSRERANVKSVPRPVPLSIEHCGLHICW